MRQRCVGPKLVVGISSRAQTKRLQNERLLIWVPNIQYCIKIENLLYCGMNNSPPTIESGFSFTPWPVEDRDLPSAMFDLFRTLTCRVEMNFTEAKFEDFQKSLFEVGITLREVERIPTSKNSAA